MHLKKFTYYVFILFIGFTSCAAPRLDVGWPEPRPLGKDIQTYHSSQKLTIDTPALIQFEEPTGDLTLRQALSLALMKNPELAAFSFSIRAKEAIALQAGLLPNPEIVVEAENFAGSGAFRRFEGTETTIQLSQLIELAGKPSKKRRVAALERDLAGWDYETKRLDILTNVTKAFIDVLAAQDSLALNQDLIRLAEEIYYSVSEQVKVGKVSPVEETRAKVALASSRIELERAKRRLENVRRGLATMWGSSLATFDRVKGDIQIIPPSIPSYDQIVSLINQNPDLARWSVEMEQRRAAVKLEDAKRIPDLTISGGLRRLNETGDKAFVFALSIPIPIFNRNQGGALEARFRLKRAEQELRNSEMNILATLAESYQKLLSAFTEANVLKNEILPGAQSAFEAIEEGYRQGKFSYLEVLDSQRTLFEAKNNYIQALSAYHKYMADIERLIGAPIESVKKEGGQ